MPARDWLTTEEVAELMGLKATSVASLSHAARKGVPGANPNFPQPVAQKVTLYERQDVLRFLEERAKNPSRLGRPPKKLDASD